MHRRRTLGFREPVSIRRPTWIRHAWFWSGGQIPDWRLSATVAGGPPPRGRPAEPALGPERQRDDSAVGDDVRLRDVRLRDDTLLRDDVLLLGAGLGLLLVFALAEWRIAGEAGLPLDDSWIHVRLATNLARGHGFGINPGEPVAASTAPLWTLCLATGIAAGLPGLLATKAFGVAAYLLTALLTRRLARAVGLGRGVALAAGLGAVGLGRLAWGALSGMEVPLAAGLVAAGALAVVRDRPWTGAIAFGLATLARPEAGLLIPLHAAGAGRVRTACARAAVAGLVLLPAVGFSLYTVGRVVPATVAAKVEGGLLGRAEGLPGAWRIGAARALDYGVEWGRLLLADHWALPALALAGPIALRRSRLRWLLLALLLHPVAVGLLAPYRGPAFQTGRYSSHLLPLALVSAAAGLALLLAAVPTRVGRAAVLAALGAALLWNLSPAARDYGWGVQNINGMQVHLGRWVRGHTPPDAVLAVNDLGALSYFGERRVLDLMGLATPAILPSRREGPAAIARFVETRCPDYLVIFPEWFPELAARADWFRPLARVRLAHNLVAGAAEMVVYETVWNRGAVTPRRCSP